MRFRFIAFGVYCVWLGLTYVLPDQPSTIARLGFWFILWLIGSATDELLRKLARASEKGE